MELTLLSFDISILHMLCDFANGAEKSSDCFGNPFFLYTAASVDDKFFFSLSLNSFESFFDFLFLFLDIAFFPLWERSSLHVDTRDFCDGSGVLDAVFG